MAKSPKSKVNRQVVQKDPQKEGYFKELAEAFLKAGYRVRREKLKAGHGFKVVSGACRVLEQRFVFVDPRLTQDDQILFLKAKASALGVELPPEQVTEASASESSQAA